MSSALSSPSVAGTEQTTIAPVLVEPVSFLPELEDTHKIAQAMAEAEYTFQQMMQIRDQLVAAYEAVKQT